MEEDGFSVAPLQDFLRRLSHVRLEGTPDGVATVLPYLTNVKTLAVDMIDDDPRVTFPPSPGAVPPLEVLEKLQLGASPQVFNYLLQERPLLHLVVLCFDTDSIPPAPQPLPPIPNLRSLRVNTNPRRPDENIAHLLSSPLPSSLLHLHVAFWPSPAVLASLPATIQFLDLTLSPDITAHKTHAAWEDEATSRLAEMTRWKTERFPALRAVRIRDGFGWRARLREGVEALVENAEGFDVVREEGTWRGVLPPEWLFG